jgi:hypothetical protein
MELKNNCCYKIVIFRRHLENLPELVNEIWTVMGESGDSLRKSLIWAMETVII